MGPHGLYLNKWTPDFDPNQDVPFVLTVWVRLPHLSLHCWNSESLEAIGNNLGKYIDRAKRRDQYSCAIICVEANMEVGLPEAIKLIVADWSHVQELDYEQFPFKCRHCHSYGHFGRSCKKKVEEEAVKEKGEQWTQVQKTSTAKQGNKSKGKRREMGSSSNPTGQKHNETGEAMKEIASQNNFEVLSNPEEQVLEEG